MVPICFSRFLLASSSSSSCSFRLPCSSSSCRRRVFSASFCRVSSCSTSCEETASVQRASEMHRHPIIPPYVPARPAAATPRSSSPSSLWWTSLQCRSAERWRYPARSEERQNRRHANANPSSHHTNNSQSLRPSLNHTFRYNINQIHTEQRPTLHYFGGKREWCSPWQRSALGSC